MSDQLPERHEDTPEGLEASWLPGDPSRPFLVQTSLPQETVEDRSIILGFIDGESVKGADMINREFDIRNYIVHPVTLRNRETGELTEAIRTLLIQPDGIAFHFVSIGILQSMQKIVWQQKRVPPFDPPIRVALKRVSTGGVRQTYKLRLV